MARKVKEKITALDAQVAAGYSVPIRVTDYQHITFTHSGITASNQVIKLQGAIGSTAPTFSSAAILDNEWGYIESIDLNSQSSAIAGATGVTLNGVGVTQCSAQVDGIDWISFHVSTGSAGSATTKVTAYSNQ